MHEASFTPDYPDPRPEPHAECSAEAATEVDLSPEARRRRRLRQLDRAAAMGAELMEAAFAHGHGKTVAAALSEQLARAEFGQSIERFSRILFRATTTEAMLDKAADAKAGDAKAARAEGAMARTARDGAGPRGGGGERLSPSVVAHRRALKKRARQYLETAIKNSAPPHDFEHLLTDLDELLEDPQVLAEFNVKPIGLMVGKLCDELGVKADLSKFTDEELGFAEQMQEALAAHKAMVAKLPKLPTGFVGSPGVPPAEPLPPFTWPPPEGRDGDGAC